eukprot:TRINITY_DN2518_c0_g1_i1.p1 TRINITY_DN2518_c0_g1~~TRINITY_DN2518_c0_g1_i1.p1  ORF type:complete len:670 (+),score=199.33 TRINITY_DN2518_c0_g1_i1:314-2323(+)
MKKGMKMKEEDKMIVNKKRNEEREVLISDYLFLTISVQRDIEELFKNLPSSVIESILDKNDWDMNAAVDEIFAQRTKQDEEERARRDAEKAKEDEESKRVAELERERQTTVEQLVVKFGVPQNETRLILQQNNWSLEAAVAVLLEMDLDRKVRELRIIYRTLTEDEIRHALETISDMRGVNIALLTLKRQKKENEEIARQQELERIKKEEEERKRNEENEKLRREEEERVKECERLRIELEQKRREEEEEERILKEIKQKQLEKEEEEKRILEEKKREEEAQALVELKRERCLQMSLLITRKVEETKVQEVIALKQELEDKLREEPEHLFGSPAAPQEDSVEKKEPSGPVETLGLLVTSIIKNPPKFVEPHSDPTTNISTSTTSTDSSVGPTTSCTEKIEETPEIVKISISPHRTDFGKSINVVWEHTGEATYKDWIALYSEGNGDRDYITYEWVSQKKGLISFSAPHVYGKYFVRYLTNGTYNSCGISNSILVGPIYSFSGQLQGNTAVISVVIKEGVPTTDAWVAMYPKGKDVYYNYQWLDKTDLTFDLPKVGSWIFKLFPHRASVAVHSCEISYEGENSLELSLTDHSALIKYSIPTLDPACDSVWVGIYFVDEGNQRQYRRKKGISSREGSLEVKKMLTKGVYEARLFACGTYEVLLRSNQVAID